MAKFIALNMSSPTNKTPWMLNFAKGPDSMFRISDVICHLPVADSIKVSIHFHQSIKISGLNANHFVVCIYSSGSFSLRLLLLVL